MIWFVRLCQEPPSHYIDEVSAWQSPVAAAQLSLALAINLPVFQLTLFTGTNLSHCLSCKCFDISHSKIRNWCYGKLNNIKEMPSPLLWCLVLCFVCLRNFLRFTTNRRMRIQDCAPAVMMQLKPQTRIQWHLGYSLYTTSLTNSCVTCLPLGLLSSSQSSLAFAHLWSCWDLGLALWSDKHTCNTQHRVSFVSTQATQALETWLILSLLLPRKHAFIHLNPSLKLLLCFILSKRQHFAPEQDLLDAAPRMLCPGVGVQPCPPGAEATPPQLHKNISLCSTENRQKQRVRRRQGGEKGRMS